MAWNQVEPNGVWGCHFDPSFAESFLFTKNRTSKPQGKILSSEEELVTCEEVKDLGAKSLGSQSPILLT